MLHCRIHIFCRTIRFILAQCTELNLLPIWEEEAEKKSASAGFPSHPREGHLPLQSGHISVELILISRVGSGVSVLPEGSEPVDDSIEWNRT